MPMCAGHITQHITMTYIVGKSNHTYKYTEAWPISASCSIKTGACDHDYFLVPVSALKKRGRIEIRSVAWYEPSLPRTLAKRRANSNDGLWGVLPGKHGHVTTKNYLSREVPKLIRDSKGSWPGGGQPIRWVCKYKRHRMHEWKRCVVR